LLREICELDPFVHPAFDSIRNFSGSGDRVSFLRAGERNQILGEHFRKRSVLRIVLFDRG
jgi:hypothetical protein